MSELDLKPCPFCGNKDVKPLKTDSEKWYTIECHNCFVSAGLHDTPRRAIDTWNRRTPDDALIETWKKRAVKEAQHTLRLGQKLMRCREVLQPFHEAWTTLGEKDYPYGVSKKMVENACRMHRELLRTETDTDSNPAEWNDELIREMLGALRFARSVIENGEPWTYQCEYSIGNAIRKATEHLRMKREPESDNEG